MCGGKNSIGAYPYCDNASSGRSNDCRFAGGIRRLCVGCVPALSACGEQNNEAVSDNPDTVTENTPEGNVAGDAHILVAYFSQPSNTQQVANRIPDKTGGEIFRITAEVRSFSAAPEKEATPICAVMRLCVKQKNPPTM